MSRQYWISFILSCIFGYHHTHGQGDIQFRESAVCYDDSQTVQRFSCQSTELIIINKAFDAKARVRQSRFCENPIIDWGRDCMKFEYQRTYDMLVDCGRKSYCNRYPPYRTVSSCGDEYEGKSYLAVQYACYSRYNNGTGNYYHYVPFHLNRDDWYLGNRALIYTERYPQWQNAYQYQGACQVSLPADGYLVVHVLDFRGRRIDSVEGCPIYLTLHDGTDYQHICGGRDWTYTRYEVRPRSAPWRVDIIVSSDTEDSEGRVQLLVEGLTSTDQYVDQMDMACGQNLNNLYTVTATTPTTTTTSTTTTTTTHTTTTTPTTTTTAPTTTTTRRPTTTTTIIPTHKAPTPGLPTTTPSGGDTTTVVGTQSQKTDWTPIIMGCSIGGLVLLVIIILAVTLTCTRRNRKKQQRAPGRRKSVSSNDMIFAFNGTTQNGHLTDPRMHGKKQQEPQEDRHYNAYITNTTTNTNKKENKKDKKKAKTLPPPTRSQSDEVYDMIEDGSAPTNTWMTDNRSLAVNSPHAHTNHTYDPSFEEPTERTLKLAKGTTRGFNY